MKKIAFLGILFLFSLSLAYSSMEVSMQLPIEITSGESFESTIFIESEESKFDVALILPLEWDVEDWTSSETLEFEREQTYYLGKQSNVFRWASREKVDEPFEINAIISPVGDETPEIHIVWIYPGGFSSDKYELRYPPVDFPVGITFIILALFGVAVVGIILFNKKSYIINYIKGRR